MSKTQQVVLERFWTDGEVPKKEVSWWRTSRRLDRRGVRLPQWACDASGMDTTASKAKFVLLAVAEPAQLLPELPESGIPDRSTWDYFELPTHPDANFISQKEYEKLAVEWALQMNDTDETDESEETPSELG